MSNIQTIQKHNGTRLYDWDTGEDLTFYGSGNGALSFCWQRNGKATGRQVTLEEAERLKDLQDYLSNYQMIVIYGIPYAYEPVLRLDQEHVVYNAKKYRYTRQHEQSFNVFYFDEEDQQEHEVKNLNIKGAIMFFVNNEEEIRKEGRK